MIINQFLIWCIAWAALMDGIIGILTFGLVSFRLTLKMARKTTAWRYEANAN